MHKVVKGEKEDKERQLQKNINALIWHTHHYQPRATRINIDMN